MCLNTEISLVLSKYENLISTDQELLDFIYKEFNKKYTKEDLLNIHIPMTELEIENKMIESYGDFNYN